MISVLASFLNSRDRAVNLFQSMLHILPALSANGVEFLLIDDVSDPAQQIPQLFEEFRAKLPAGTVVKQFLFNQHQHYTRALAYGLSAAKGDNVLFVSHDMLLTSDYVRTLLGVAGSDKSIGLVRGTSPYVDCFPNHVITPPAPIRTLEELEAFAAYVSQYYGLSWEEDRLLTGDSMLITRAALNKIGVFDPRYFGYFGDIDFGMRLQRAGLKMVCAKGAWLWHEGAAAYKHRATQTHTDYAAIHERRMRVVNDAYKLFRSKWDLSLPENYPGTDAIPFETIRARSQLAAGAEFQPAVFPDAAICTIR